MKELGRHGGAKLILGLGNPGEEYENTYHNVGALAVRALAAADAGGVASSEGEGGDGSAWKNHGQLFLYQAADRWSLILPLVFMNESGLAAKEALKKFNTMPENLIVIHDDSDLTLGEFKISRGQGAAGHKGVQSIIDHLGTQEFERVRIGIRAKEAEMQKQRKKAGEFVLNQITAREGEILKKVFGEIAAALAI